MYKLLEEVQNPSMKYNQNQKIIAFTNIHHHWNIKILKIENHMNTATLIGKPPYNLSNIL